MEEARVFSSLQWPEWLWGPPNLQLNWALVALSWRGVKWYEVAEV